MQKHLVPALKREGIDLDNNTAVATAIGKLSGNSNASAMLTRMVTQREQTERWLRIMGEAMGLDAAEDARHNDPIVGWAGFKGALKNLSAALIPIDAINAGLNKLADGINGLSKLAKDDPALAGFGLAMSGYGMYAGGKFAINKIGDLFGLRASALALDGSAAALTRAAVMLGGGSAGDIVGGGKGKVAGKVGWLGALGAGSTALIAGSLALGSSSLLRTSGEQARVEALNERSRRHFAPKGPTHAQERERDIVSGMYLPRDNGPGGIHAATMGSGVFDRMLDGMNKINSSTVSPNIDTSAVDTLLAKVRQAARELAALGAAAVQAERSVGVELRRNFADTGG